MPDLNTITPPPPANPPSAVYDFQAFVVYDDADRDWCVRELITPLEGAGVTVMHRGKFTLGLPESRTEDEAIRRSLRTLAFVTAEFVKNGRDTFLADRAWALERLIPILAEECNLDERFRGLTRVDLTDPGRWKAEFQRLLENLGRSAQEAQAAAAQQVVRGLKALAKLMRIPPVQEAVSKYETSFTAAASEIEQIDHLKALHDDFQTAEGSFRLVTERRVRGPGAGPDFDPELERGLDELLADLRQLRQTADLTGLPGHMVPWTGQLDKVVADLTAALEMGTGGRVPAPLELLARLLGTWPSRINTRIVEGVARLSLGDVANGLQSVRDTLTEHFFDEQAEALFDDFKKTVASLRTLARNLDALHANHNWLQQISDSLAPLQGVWNPAPNDIRVQWDFVVGPLSNLDAAAGPNWVNEFRERAAAVQAAQAAATPAGERALCRAFNMFRTELDKVFNRADRDLLTLCADLKKVGEALRQTIQRMQHG
jgi:hypothetical protein